MAVVISRATGNWLTAGTWGLVDATSYNNTETTTTALTTSYQASNGSTTGVITTDGVALKLSVRTGTTGTMSVHLAIAGVEVTGTLVTINTADLPVAATADLNGGWIFFKFAAPVVLVGATSYTVEAKTSSAAQVSLFSTATTNWARAISTTATGAPVAGDDVIITGEYTGAGTSNAFTVTMNETATTDYGSASTSLVTPAISICSKGTLLNGTTATTNYNLKVSGNIVIYSGGEFDLGTVATAMPRDSSMTLLFDCAANVDFGLTVRNLGKFVSQGQSRTAAKLIYYCKLNTDEAVASTSLGVDTDTGWLDNDAIAIASTTQTGSQTEAGALNGAAGASTLTVDGFAGAGGGLANAHGGTSPILSEIILLTRNVLIQGASISLQAYINIATTATVDCDWTEFKWLGSNTAGKFGFDIATTTGSASFTYCSLHDFGVAGARVSITGVTNNNWTFQYIGSYNLGTSSAVLRVAATSGTAWVIDNWISMGNTGSATIFDILDIGGTFTNISAVGNSTTGPSINITEASGTPFGTIGPLTCHSNGGIGITWGGGFNGSIAAQTIWRNANGITIASIADVIMDTITIFGNVTQNFTFNSGVGNLVIKNVVSSGDTTFATTSGILSNSNDGGKVTFQDSTFGVVSGIKTAHTRDVNTATVSFLTIIFQNCLLASATELSTQTNMPPGALVGSEKHDQTAGNHKAWKREGTITTDTVIYDVSPSARIAPLFAAEKCESSIFRSVVASGATLAVSVKVRESVVGDGTAYNGSRIRLLVKSNAAVGIASDTVLATATVASSGAFETLSGTAAAVTDDGALDFVVDCDGTTGWINYDTWAVTTQTSSLGLKYWEDGQPVAYGDNSAGGTGGVVKFAGDGGGFAG